MLAARCFEVRKMGPSLVGILRDRCWDNTIQLQINIPNFRNDSVKVRSRKTSKFIVLSPMNFLI